MDPWRFAGMAIGVMLLPLVLPACSGGGGSEAPAPIMPAPPPPPPPPPSQPGSSIEREISPAQANPAVTTNLAAHFVVTPDPAIGARNRLFVMLPGTGAPPRIYRLIVRTGAAEGYHALGLTYPNDEAVGVLCAGNTDPDCSGKSRREIITGEDLSPVVSVDGPNSITGRLQSLLSYLDTTYPDEGWGQFLIAGQPNWSRITAAGHSQGAGHAGFLAKLHPMERIVMFSGPGDIGLNPFVPAPWLSLPNITPASRQYGFTHTTDPLVPLQRATGNWALAGLDAFGPVTSVDGVAPPFGGSRQLTTSLPANPDPLGVTAAPTHGSPVADAVTPRDGDGNPVYQPVWVYLAFP